MIGGELVGGKKKNTPLFCVLIFMCLITTVCIYFYRQDAVARAAELTYQRMYDSVKEQCLTFDAKIEGQLAILETMTESITVEEIGDKAQMVRRMQSILSSSMFYHIGFINPDGNGFIQDGSEISVKDRRYFQKAISGRYSVAMVESDRADGEHKLVLAVPVIKNRKTIGVMVGSYNEKIFKKIFMARSFDEKSASCICASDGSIIIGSNAPKWLFYRGMPFAGEENIFNAYNKTTPTGERTARDMAMDFAFGRRGTYEYSFGKYSRYVIYEPVGINDWFLVSTIDGDAVKKIIASSSVIPFILFITISLGMFTMIAIIITIESRSRRMLEEDEARLRISEQEYRIAAQQSGKIVVRYDVKTKTEYRDVMTGGFIFGDSAVTSDVPNVYIKSGKIDKECIADYSEFYKKMEAGEKEGSTVIRVNDTDKGTFSYYRGDFTLIFDEDGKPAHAIISYYDCTKERERELAYSLMRQNLSKYPENKAKIFEYNLTSDIEERVSGEFDIDADEWKNLSFNDRTLFVAKKHVHHDDAASYISFFNRERLLSEFQRGVGEETAEFRMGRLDEKGYLWHRVTISMVEYPKTREVKAFIVVENIDEEKKLRISQQERLNEDQLTKVLNRTAFAEKVAEIIRENPNSEHAVIMIDLDNFKQVNDKLGHMKGDEVLVDTAKKLESMLRAGDAVGRMGGDEFMLCLKNIPDREVAGKRAKQICEVLCSDIEGEVKVSGSLGIAIYPSDGTTFQELYQNSDTAVYIAKKGGRRRCQFYKNYDELECCD